MVHPAVDGVAPTLKVAYPARESHRVCTAGVDNSHSSVVIGERESLTSDVGLKSNLQSKRRKFFLGGGGGGGVGKK